MAADYESRVQVQLQICDSRIKELEAKAKQTPELEKQCKEEVSQMIVKMEDLKRGLLEIADEEELCSSSLLEKTALDTGTWMFMTGVLILGPVGFLLLLVLFYSMLVENLALATVTGLFYVSPMIFLAIWASLKWASVIRERFARKATAAPGALPILEHEKD